MLGSAVLRVMHEKSGMEVLGTIRTTEQGRHLDPRFQAGVRVVADLEDLSELDRCLGEVRPDVVINCVALRRRAGENPDFQRLIALFALLPQRLSRLCLTYGARLIQISSDGVFSGLKGSYTEDDCPDATDAYGIAKILGEVRESHAITIRTSILGHELASKTGLLEWFLAQDRQCRCYTRAIFSGLPTVVLARILRDIVLPTRELSGIYHVASQPISKHDLLRIVAKVYNKNIEIIPDDRVIIDRSLATDKFARATGYVVPDWTQLIQTMHSSQESNYV